MTGVHETWCRFCLKTVIVKSFALTDNVINDILDVLLKSKFDCESNDVICNACRRKLYAAFEFKSTCLNTDSTIVPYVDCEKMLQLDIREIYLKERSEDISDSQIICRLCMHPVKGEFSCIREEELEAIEKLAPEMNINVIKDPVVCKPCYDSLCTHNSFLKNCLEVENKIRGIYDGSVTESQTDTSPSDLFVKTENTDKEFDINNVEMSIKTESIDIKSEDEESSDTLLQDSDSGLFKKKDCKDVEHDGCKPENKSENKCNTNSKQEHKVSYKCINETGSKSCFTAHRARHKNDSEVYKCESCKYGTKNKELLQKHLLRHKNPSEILTHLCESCNYKTKYRSVLAKHQAKHKSASGARWYQCNLCDFKTKQRSNFNSHYIKHKNSNKRDEFDHKTKCDTLPHKEASLQLPVYKCASCNYESKNRKLFIRHGLVHKDPSQVKMYRCDDCNYETKYSSVITQYQLTHKDPSQVKIKHQLIHKDPSHVQMYTCSNCDYETKYKSCIKRHQLKQENPSQVQMYRCNDCDYKAKYRSNIKRHQQKHENPSQVQMYRCNDCGYEDKYRSNMKRHQLKHENPSHVQMYRCSDCDYETKYRSNINRHQLKHEKPSQVHR
ncbi:zinc finger protein 11-like [Anoplophora glabripennis]|uniref:zinc finger protein 11-like n=1 Tax=Anoplophora glabripennis TaxID=217634 RepID=UPI000C7567C6|nr:zinc finger protein 11-like [Anoplophora glabripennis]